nr:MAG TPA: hypothetical protein [Caudoviricetes sp.]
MILHHQVLSSILSPPSHSILQYYNIFNFFVKVLD